MGTNIGHGAIINFIKANEERVQQLLIGAISFIEDVPLMSCKSSTNDMLAPWYFNSSLVFATPAHNFWSSEVARKQRKRFGKVQMSSQETITDMLIEHKQQVFDFLLAKTGGWKVRKSKDEDNRMMDASRPEPASPPKSRLPPVGLWTATPNSPRASTRSPAQPSVSSQVTSPRAGALPPMANFVLSPRERPPRSPGR